LELFLEGMIELTQLNRFGMNIILNLVNLSLT